ncbi:M48 family metallopeptidase [Planctomycetota bacterium]
MKSVLISKLVIIFSLICFLIGCTIIDISGRRQLNLVPDSMMNSMSFQSYDEFLSAHRLSTNTQQVQMVKRVGSRIQEAVERYCLENGIEDRLAGYDWEFNLVEDPNVNAWCMPGGKVVVYTGLLPVAQTEAGLAVVVGHEIAHAFAKHGAERMTQGLLVQMGGMALSKALEDRPQQTQNLFMQSYGVGSQVGLLLPYSRVHESEADHLGLIFMAMAGYDPQEAASFWQRMAEGSGGTESLEILSTHPSDTTRIRKIKEVLPEAMRYYQQQ